MTDIPFLGNFEKNAAGMLVGIIMTLILIYWLSSASGISPITDTSISDSLGCSACGPGGTSAGLYFAVQWLGFLTISFIPFIFIMGFIAKQNSENQEAGPKMLKTQEPLEYEE